MNGKQEIFGKIKRFLPQGFYTQNIRLIAIGIDWSSVQANDS